ncbi:MAG: hypothetical protein AAGC99_23115, partial [Pseudomonadota bacterium]
SDQPDTVDLTALQWLNRKEPRASEKNRHHHRSVKKSETSKRFVTTKIEGAPSTRATSGLSSLVVFALEQTHRDSLPR